MDAFIIVLSSAIVSPEYYGLFTGGGTITISESIIDFYGSIAATILSPVVRMGGGTSGAASMNLILSYLHDHSTEVEFGHSISYTLPCCCRFIDRRSYVLTGVFYKACYKV